MTIAKAAALMHTPEEVAFEDGFCMQLIGLRRVSYVLSSNCGTFVM
jgi:hypothetical protein